MNTTSIQSKEPSPQLLAYAAIKGPISNFTAALAQMLGDRGIRVKAVAPGPIWTPLIPSPMVAEKAASFGQQTPLSRAGQPTEVAPVFVLLASDEASYISGAVVPVTGTTARSVRIVAEQPVEARPRQEQHRLGLGFSTEGSW